MKYVLFFTLIVVFIFAVVFGVNNDQLVVFNYLLGCGQYSLAQLLGASFALGFLLGCGILILFYLKLRFKLSFVKSKLHSLEERDRHLTKMDYTASPPRD